MKKYKKIVTSILVILVVGLGIWMTNKTEDSKSGIKIGVISSMTGLVLGGDNLGQGFTNGVLLAHEEYLANNPNKNIEIVIEDDGYDLKKGVSAYQKLASIDKVDSIINLSSVTLDAVKSLLIESDVPVVQVFAETEISEDNIYQIYPDQTAVGILGKIANEDGVKRVMIAHPQIQAYSKVISDFKDNYGGELIIETFSPTEKNMSPVALKIKEVNPDGLVVFMGSVEGSQLMKELRNINYKPQNAYFDIGLQFGVADYKNILGDLNYMNGFKAIYLSVSGDDKFKSKYESRFGQKTPMLAALGYDSYMAMVENYEKDTTQWRKNMNSYKRNGFSGEITFTPEGVRPAQWQVLEIQNGEIDMK